MYYKAGEDLVFTAQRAATLAGRRFQDGDQVIVRLAEDWRDNLVGDGGPWGWGGYTSRSLRRLAARITDTAGTVFYSA